MFVKANSFSAMIREIYLIVQCAKNEIKSIVFKFGYAICSTEWKAISVSQVSSSLPRTLRFFVLSILRKRRILCPQSNFMLSVYEKGKPKL